MHKQIQVGKISSSDFIIIWNRNWYAFIDNPHEFGYWYRFFYDIKFIITFYIVMVTQKEYVYFIMQFSNLIANNKPFIWGRPYSVIINENLSGFSFIWSYAKIELVELQVWYPLICNASLNRFSNSVWSSTMAMDFLNNV